jgi:hypothetical protein
MPSRGAPAPWRSQRNWIYGRGDCHASLAMGNRKGRVEGFERGAPCKGRRGNEVLEADLGVVLEEVQEQIVESVLALHMGGMAVAREDLEAYLRNELGGSSGL